MFDLPLGQRHLSIGSLKILLTDTGMFFFLFAHELSDELVSHDEEYEEETADLGHIGRVVVVDDREPDSENLSGGDHEGHEMLFELLDHPVDKHLPQEWQNAEL